MSSFITSIEVFSEQSGTATRKHSFVLMKSPPKTHSCRRIRQTVAFGNHLHQSFAPLNDESNFLQVKILSLISAMLFITPIFILGQAMPKRTLCTYNYSSSLLSCMVSTRVVLGQNLMDVHSWYQK